MWEEKKGRVEVRGDKDQTNVV